MTRSSFLRRRMLAALALAVSSLAGTSAAYAQLSIESDRAGANRIPVTIADFGGDPGMSRAVTSVIRSDLERSGLFKLVEQAQPGLTEASSIDFNAARSRAPRRSRCRQRREFADGRPEARFRLFDTNKGTTRRGRLRDRGTATARRRPPHRRRHLRKLIGEPGIFSTRIAYVVKAGINRFELQIADADGQNAQAALISKEPIISPAWSPNGRHSSPTCRSRTRSR